MRRTLPILLCALALAAGGFLPRAAAQSEGRSGGGEAEEASELETDRDAFTPANSTVGARQTVLEISYSFIDNRDLPERHSYPESLARYGLSDRIELRFGWNYEVGGSGGDVSSSGGGDDFEGSGVERDSALLYGLKVATSEQEGWRPRSALILQGRTPTRGEATASDVVVAYAFGWELGEGWRLDSSMRFGTQHAVGDAFNEWAPSVALRMPMTERWQVHAEYFGIYSDGTGREFSRAFFSPGTHYLVGENLELGLRLGWGLTNDAPNFFSNVGVGWRF